MRHFLDFEKPIANLEGKVEELRHMSTDGSINIADEIGKLQTRIERELKQTYEKLGAWEKVQVARHPDRPKIRAIFDRLFDDFTPLAGVPRPVGDGDGNRKRKQYRRAHQT